MSLLPGQILPQTEPIGKPNADGDIIIDKNWWLFLYALAKNALGNQTVSAEFTFGVDQTDLDVVDSDSSALRSPIANLQVQQVSEYSPATSDLPDIYRAILLTQDNLLQDPPQSVKAIDSIIGTGIATNPLQLSGDVLNPGNGFYYGTNASGVKGWYANPAIPAPANPTASVGLTAINGTATTFMRSDAAPPISQAIVPTWTGAHIFAGGGSVGGAGVNTGIELRGSNQAVIGQINSAAPANSRINISYVDGSGIQHYALQNDAASVFTDWMTVSRSGTTPTGVSFNAPIGVNGATPPAQSTGWGTPTGGSAVSNFPGAGPATLAQCSAALAQIIAVLKANGLLGT